MSLDLRHEPEERRYALRDGDALVSVLEYVPSDQTVSFVHTYTDPAHRNQGYAERLMAFAVDDVASSGRRIAPACSFAADWFAAHPERDDLLA